MTWRRRLAYAFALLGLLVVCCVLYLAFGDLGRHKERIESFVTKYTGRAFVIDGPFELRLVPVVTVLAERVRFANAEWGSQPQMVEVGHLSAKVGFWSLFSGPVDVRSFELSDVSVVLEQQRDGKANWVLKEPSEEEDDADAEPKTRTEFPVVIEKAKLTDVRLTYRASGKPEMLARLDTLTITPGQAGLLGLEGSGKLDQFPISLKGEAGPIEALLAGRNIRMNLNGKVGRLALDIAGGFGDLDPLDGANLKIKATGEDVGAMLARLNMPVIATGALAIDAELTDAGKRTQFVFDATVGDLAAKARGSLGGLYLRGADINFEARAADAARLASVFGVDGLPAAPLTVSGHVVPTRKEIRFEALKTQLGGFTSQIDGTFKQGRHPELALGFDIGVENLKNLRDNLPEGALSAKGKFAVNAQQLEIRDLAATLGGNSVNGSFMMTRSQPRRIEADLSFPRLDLTPYLAASPEAAPPGSPTATAKPPPAKPPPAKPKDAMLFSDAPLPIRQLKGNEGKVHVAIAELALANKTFHEVDSTLILDSAHVEWHARAKGSLDGTVDASISIEPVEPDGANVSLKFALENVRAGADMKDMQASEVPPLGVVMDLTTHGASAHQMAVNSNGHILLTQGAGKTKAEFLNAFGGDAISQLRTKLNPFRAQDPFTTVDCTIVRADIVNGQVTVTPVLVQTQKVTVAATGKIDLKSEHLTFDFDTRPRKGIGVSPGMFTNPFIKVEGTLATPRIAVGAKGVRSGAFAAATGGLSVIAGGFIDRLKGEANMCRRVLEQATVAKRAD